MFETVGFFYNNKCLRPLLGPLPRPLPKRVLVARGPSGAIPNLENLILGPVLEPPNFFDFLALRPLAASGGPWRPLAASWRLLAASWRPPGGSRRLPSFLFPRSRPFPAIPRPAGPPPTSSSIIEHHQTSSNIIKHHQTTSNIMKHYIFQHQQTSSDIMNIIKHHLRLLYEFDICSMSPHTSFFVIIIKHYQTS